MKKSQIVRKAKVFELHLEKLKDNDEVTECISTKSSLLLWKPMLSNAIRTKKQKEKPLWANSYHGRSKPTEKP